jgi:hypothetical protein
MVQRCVEYLECPHPVLGCRASSAAAVGMEGAFKVLRDGRGRGAKWECKRRRRHLGAGAIAAVGKAALGDRLFDRHLPRAAIATGKGMATHEQQVEDQDRETEGIVIGRPPHITEIAAQKLGRREQFDADPTGEA